MTTLDSQLQAFNASIRAQAPKPVLDAIEAANQRLAESGLVERALKAGDRAPAFVLPDATGRDVDSKLLLGRGALVLSSYRGAWCPYCNLELQSWQQHLPQLRSLGATLVAVSPQTPDASLTLAQKHALAYPVLSDLGHRVARQFGIVFKVDAALKPVFEAFGIDLVAHNGDSSFELPIPATYLIRPDGTIADAWVDVDYRRRAEPSQVIERLRECALQA